MKTHLQEKIRLIETSLVCPESGGLLTYRTDHFYCADSGRSYPFYDDAILEMMPASPVDFADSDPRSQYHEQVYKKLFATQLQDADPNRSWAIPEAVPEGWRTRKLNHVSYIRRLVEAHTQNRELFCDFTGASGYYSFEMARLFKWVFHCDISAESMQYARQKASKLGIDNMLFIRADYFRPPFRNVIDVSYCGDTLIYSPPHEERLLRGMHQSLKPGGTALFDFHNWWHNPLRRLGLMSNTFGECFSYNKQEATRFTRQYFTLYQQLGYYQEFASGHLPWWMPGLFPSTRHLFIATKEQ